MITWNVKFLLKRAKLLTFCAIILCMAIATVTPQSIDEPLEEPVTDEIIIADFNNPPNNLGESAYSNRGGQYGTWDLDPTDETQTCLLSFSHDDVFNKGYSIELHYDVDTPRPAYNGFWLKLMHEDFTSYNTLNLYIKGDRIERFTKRLKIELKDPEKTAAYVISGITDEWQKFSIPFEKYRRIKDWSQMNEFVVVFDDIVSKPKNGIVYIDHITVSKEPIATMKNKRRVRITPLHHTL